MIGAGILTVYMIERKQRGTEIELGIGVTVPRIEEKIYVCLQPILFTNRMLLLIFVFRGVARIFCLREPELWY